MKSFVLLNGSPRGERANSMKMMAKVAAGWQSEGGEAAEILHLAKPADFERAVDVFGQAETVLLGMPLYTDCMPALVMRFLERLEEGGLDKRPRRLAFLVQSGFPEATHSRRLERYFEKLTRRIGCQYGGTIVRGGGEALQMMPEQASGKLWAQLRTLGGELRRDGAFGAESLRKVAGMERLSGLLGLLAPVIVRIPWIQFYWRMQLKKNGVWQRRFDAPHAGVITSR